MLNYPEKISYSQITKREKITHRKHKETLAEPPQESMAKIENLGDTAEAIARLSPEFKQLNPEEQRQAVERTRKDLESQSENRE